jgi:hypothetical protein
MKNRPGAFVGRALLACLFGHDEATNTMLVKVLKEYSLWNREEIQASVKGELIWRRIEGRPDLHAKRRCPEEAPLPQFVERPPAILVFACGREAESRTTFCVDGTSRAVIWDR